MSCHDITDVLMGSSGILCEFENPGDTISGKILSWKPGGGGKIMQNYFIQEEQKVEIKRL